jgi:hypothetical protein
VTARSVFVALFALTAARLAANEPPSLDVEAVEVRVVAVAAGKPDFAHVRGTAFLVGPRGLLATAEHVVLNDKQQVIENLFILRPTPPETTISRVRVVKRFGNGRDLALLQMNRKPEDPNLPCFEIGDAPKPGAEIFMAGYPLVFDKVYRWPLFRFGRIGSVRYYLRQSKVLVLDMVSADGFSGSPVIRSSDGKVLGVQKGGATGNAYAGFSVATELTAADLVLSSKESENPSP